MNWPNFFSPEPSSRWVVVMAGHDVTLSLKMALPGKWFRVLPARDCKELEQRVRIIAPAMILVEMAGFQPHLLRQLGDFHRRHPLLSWIAVLDTEDSDLTTLMAEQGARRTLVKPLDCRTVRKLLETERADTRPG